MAPELGWQEDATTGAPHRTLKLHHNLLCPVRRACCVLAVVERAEYEWGRPDNADSEGVTAFYEGPGEMVEAAVRRRKKRTRG
jgi:hypothetical protein